MSDIFVFALAMGILCVIGRNRPCHGFDYVKRIATRVSWSWLKSGNWIRSVSSMLRPVAPKASTATPMYRVPDDSRMHDQAQCVQLLLLAFPIGLVEFSAITAKDSAREAMPRFSPTKLRKNSPPTAFVTPVDPASSPIALPTTAGRPPR